MTAEDLSRRPPEPGYVPPPPPSAATTVAAASARGWRPRDEELAYLRKLLIALAIVALALAAWHVREAFLLAFASVVVGVILDSMAEPLSRRTGLARHWALAIVAVAVIAALAGAVVLTGSQVRAQFGEFAARLPEAVRYLEGEFGVEVPFLNGSGGSLQDQKDAGGGMGLSTGLIGPLKSIGITLFEGITNLVLVVVGGAFLAADPGLYRRGALKLFPTDRHARVGDALETCGRALKLWLLAQLVAMTIIGVMAGLGTWWLGVPAPLALGLFAGLAEFVPVVGSIAGAVPAIVLAFAVDVDTALWTAALFVVIQQLESNVINPILQRRMVSIPPAVQLFSIVAFGILFGWAGLLLAAPLAVVAFVLVQKLYVRQTLGEDVKIPGEDKAGSGAT